VCSDIACDPDGFRCEDRYFATGTVIAEYLARSERIVLATATVGAGYAELKEAYASDDDLLMGYVLDAAGSEFAELLADQVHHQVAAFGRDRQLGCSNRYSPGYCGWATAEQKHLFALLPPGFCGITLSASALMTPIKSVSCVIGLGREVVKAGYRCDICTLENCCKRP
jgi:cobalamin-dependent methionine synthase I